MLTVAKQKTMLITRRPKSINVSVFNLKTIEARTARDDVVHYD